MVSRVRTANQGAADHHLGNTGPAPTCAVDRGQRVDPSRVRAGTWFCRTDEQGEIQPLGYKGRTGYPVRAAPALGDAPRKEKEKNTRCNTLERVELRRKC